MGKNVNQIEGVKIRRAVSDDLDRIAYIESRVFPVIEAASKETYDFRMKAYGDLFFVAVIDEEIVGLVCGCTTDKLKVSDDMYKCCPDNPQKGENSVVLSLGVLPEYQRRGIAEMLMDHLIDQLEQAKSKVLILTCKEHVVSYYEKFGFVNRGRSQSSHGGAEWYDMARELQ